MFNRNLVEVKILLGKKKIDAELDDAWKSEHDLK